ncbi:hypothetical protein GGR52DRAFT_78118 [Hypoxylon sp. FL1284]|nr:hypothetical protein GGR52DRAFT_78118 [Hypoxylon sp. FL1284]
MDMATGSNWGGNAPGVDEYGLHVRPMGLKVQYTFDKDAKELCLARWPTVLQIQTAQLDEQVTIGIVDLKTCLQAVVQCSPELVGDDDKDYTIYALDYSEQNTPLVGQGMLSWALTQGPSAPNPQSQMVTGRITKNMLAMFGNGARDTLEVRLKLTAILKTTRSNQAPPRPSAEPSATQRTSTPTPSESNEWASFRQSTPSLGQSGGASANPAPIAPAPVRSFHSRYDARNEMALPAGPGPQLAPKSRPGSVEPSLREQRGLTLRDSNALEKQGPLTKEATSVPAPAPAPAPASTSTKSSKPQSRPTSRASSRPPSGRPRGRPRKKPLPTEGNTSGYEDGTDADDGPPRNKKRATMTKVERSSNNSAAFSSAPESLRVAASTSGSIRNFRPISIAGDTATGANGQDVPRAPTPIPDSRRPGAPHARSLPTSNLRRESMSGLGADRSLTPSYIELSRSTSYSQDARSPVESIGATPSQTYSDGPSPADIGSSPPVPRSAMYSVQSSPAPSSPILPPMPIAVPQPDSGFMSGGLDESRGEEIVKKGSKSTTAKRAPAATKPKPRRSRAKKVPPNTQSDLIIHTETPGPPELLPQTSLYNPPHLGRKNSEAAKTPVASGPPNPPPQREMQGERMETSANEGQISEKIASPADAAGQGNIVDLHMALMSDFIDNHQQHLDFLEDHSSTPAAEDVSKNDDIQLPEAIGGGMEPPALPRPSQDPSAEPELPIVPASDPVLPQLPRSTSFSEPAHPQTDAVAPADGKSNKNFVKRQTIIQKLEDAIAQGQCPSFCRNCGALQTPTWRKVWKQQHHGVPSYHEYSEKPGQVTAINVLLRDDEGKPTLYEKIKKSLGPEDNKSAWTEVLLCNPCGIWFSKFKGHRPSEKWEKDGQRLCQTRKKRSNGGGALPRSKKPRTKGDSQANLTSEAYLPTDALGPPEESVAEPGNQPQLQGDSSQGPRQGAKGPTSDPKCLGSTHSRASTHSRGSGTPDSPIAINDDLGGTRRLLFPSPRKDGEPRVLGEVDVNIVHTSPDSRGAKGEPMTGEENGGLVHDQSFEKDDFVDIFGTPPRPSTPPLKAMPNAGPFKTPTHPTPSHRPVTRSVTKSMRSVNSPGHILMDRTPTRTPRSGSVKRPSPSDLLSTHLLNMSGLDTPFSRSMHDLVSEATHFVMPSPQRGAFQMDLNSLPALDMPALTSGGLFDIGNYLSTDVPMPSSPPPPRNELQKTGFSRSLTYDDNAHMEDWERQLEPVNSYDMMHDMNDEGDN